MTFKEPPRGKRSPFADREVDVDGMRPRPTSGLTRAVSSCPSGLTRIGQNSGVPLASLPRPIPSHSCGQRSMSHIDECSRSAGTEAGIAELRSLLSSDHFGDSPPRTTMFGVSPPLRTGAANPLGHSTAFSRVAPMACKRNLQILEQLQFGPATGLTPSGDRGLLRVSPSDGKASPLDIASSFNEGRSFSLFPSSYNRNSASGKCSPSPHQSVSPTDAGKLQAGC